MRPFQPSTISEGVRGLTDEIANAVARAAMKHLSGAVKAIAADIRDERFEDAKAGVRELEFTEAVAKSTKAMRKFTRSAALTGAGAVDSPKDSIWANGAPFPWEVYEGAVRLLGNMVTHVLDRDIRRRLEDRITAASRFQKAKPINPQKLGKDINRFLRGEIVRVTDVSANVVGTRTAAYGMYHEARVRGIARYRIDAIVDTRTTDICRNMNGRIFTVEEAFTKTQQVLATVNPAQVKKIAPFPELEQIANLSNEDLQALGHDTPPFHFQCRTVVTLIDTKVDYDPVAWSNYPALGKEADTAARRYNQYMDRQADKLWGAKPQDERIQHALYADPLEEPEVYYPHQYTVIGYDFVNKSLRENSPLDDDDKKMVRTLDNLIKKSKAENVMHTYRGIGKTEAKKLQVGRVFQDDAYSSTSLLPGVAGEFAHKNTIMQIEVGTGQGYLPLKNISGFEQEQEMLLPRGSQYRVIGRHKQKFQGQKYNVIRVVLQGQGKTLSANKVGESELPELESVVKEVAPEHSDKYVVEESDLREVPMRG